MTKPFTDMVNSYPFYQKARDLWEEKQIEQILKGLKKYPEPLTPSHWTIDELVNHALEEVVDLTHYLAAIKEVVAAKNQEIAHLRYVISLYKNDHWLKEQKPPYFDLDDQ